MRAAAILAIACANVFGGLSYHWSVVAMDNGLEPGMIAAFRSVCAILMMGIWLAFSTGFRFRFTGADWARLLVVGVFATGLPLTLGILGTRWSSPSNASILILLEPASILFFSWLLLREHIRTSQIVGIVIGFAGAYLVLIGDVTSWDSLWPQGLLESQYVRGNLVLIAHAVLWGVYSPVIKPLANRHRALDLGFIVMTFSLIPIVPWAGYEMVDWSPGPNLGVALEYALYLGVFVSVATTLLWNFSLRHLRASTVAPFVFLQPIVGCLTDYFLRDVPLSPGAIYGGIAICLAVLLVTYAQPPETAPPAEASS